MEQNNKPETIHYLKTWPEYFNKVFMGHKDWELRKNDRDFKVGDTVILQEFNPETKEYTGKEMARRINYILEKTEFGLQDGYVIMTIR